MSLYIWGRVDFQSSVAAKDESCIPLEFPVRIPKLPCVGPITSIAAGDQHCLFIADGAVYGFGSNKCRQLHHLALDVCDAPFQIVLPSSATGKPVQVACGAQHSLVLLDDGTVMTAGLNDLDQLGHVTVAKEKVSDDKWRPWNRAALAVPADKIVASGHSSFVLSGGQVYSWGSQRFGHLGHGTTGELERMVAGPAKFENVKYPTKIQWFATQKLRVVDIAAGPAHLVARTESEVYVVGDNSYGKLGIRSVQTISIPQRVQIFGAHDVEEKLFGIAAGADQSFAIRTGPNGATLVYQWGLIDKDSCSTPTQIAWGVPTDIQAIYGGGDFQLLVRRNGEVQSWGTSKLVYGTQNSMQSSDDPRASRRFPRAIKSMEGKFIKTAAIGRTFAVMVCDDAKFAPPPDCIPENKTLHCMVPQGHRYPLGFTPRLTPDRYENAVRDYFKRLYGAAADTYLASIPVASPAEEQKKRSIAKRGSHSLRVGSKVRVWMSDVYAWGTILGTELPEHPPHSFEVKWVREDWDPEVVQLLSDDETIDEANEDRWQHLWVLDEQ